MRHATLHGVKIGSTTTMDLPHRRIEMQGKVYYVATFPEGDLSVHEWSSRYQEGYGGSLVTFLLDDGTLETVKGPFDCNDIFDHGRRELLRNVHGIESKPTAVKIRVGTKLRGYFDRNAEESVIYEDQSLSCESLSDRIVALLAQGISCDAQWQLVYRNHYRTLQRGEIKAYIDEPNTVTA